MIYFQWCQILRIFQFEENEFLYGDEFYVVVYKTNSFFLINILINILFLPGSQKFSSDDKILKNVTTEVKNPKILNMLSAYDKAQYPLFLISDSGLMMHQDTLLDMASLMADDVGLVHQMPFTL